MSFDVDLHGDQPTPAVPSICFEPLAAEVQPPARATAQSAGYDARAYLRGRTVAWYDEENCLHEQTLPDDAEARLVLPPGGRTAIPLAFKARLPDGWEMQVRPRSGTSYKKGLLIPNAPGTIDADYPGEWKVLLYNPTAVPVTILHGEAFAQLVPARVETLAWEFGVVEQTTTRHGGFGSTDAAR